MAFRFACHTLGSHHCCLDNQKKLGKQKNQSLFLDPTKNWVFKANCHPSFSRKTGISTQSRQRWAYLEQKTLGGHKLVGTHKWQFRKIAGS